MKLSDVTELLDYQFSSESELVKSIEEISQKFTVNREKIDDYLKDTRLCSAYVCFYLLTNMPKLSASLELMSVDPSIFADYEIFDFGSGPGTFSLALLELNKNLTIKAVEKSSVMIHQGEKLVKGLYPTADFEYFKGAPLQKLRPRLGIFGHSANEMGKDITLRYIKNFELDAVLFLEPGTKQSFGVLKELRNALTKNYKLVYPCLAIDSCPLNENDWCHQYLNIKHDSSVERLTQLVKKDRRHLPMCIHYYTKEEKVRDKVEGVRAHITRVYPPTKFSLEWQVCFQGENNLVVKDLQIMFRGYSKKEVKELNTILAGDQIRFKLIKELDGNKIRGELL